MLLAGLWPKDWRFDPPAQARCGNDAQDATSCCSCLRSAASVAVMNWVAEGDWAVGDCHRRWFHQSGCTVSLQYTSTAIRWGLWELFRMSLVSTMQITMPRQVPICSESCVCVFFSLSLNTDTVSKTCFLASRPEQGWGTAFACKGSFHGKEIYPWCFHFCWFIFPCFQYIFFLILLFIFNCYSFICQ